MKVNTIRYDDIIDNDVVDGLNICTSLWVQGCPYHCKGCHNEQTWDFNAGTEINVKELTDIIIEKIFKDDINRNFSVLGGEPLCDENIDAVAYIIKKVKEEYVNRKTDGQIFLWTGEIYENLYKQIPINESMKIVLDNIDVLIDGPYMEEQRNPKLFLRGSENQRVIDIASMRKNNKWNTPLVFDKLWDQCGDARVIYNI